MAAGLAQDSGVDVVASGCQGGVFDTFADFLATQGAVVVLMVGQKEWFVWVGFCGFLVTGAPQFEKILLELLKPGRVWWQLQGFFPMVESFAVARWFSSENDV